ncbi:MAG: DUF1523 family protein [Roseobacter sp.]|jgi:hypothetical protein|nr:DUF1523 family protein [Roseobacter sp.]
MNVFFYIKWFFILSFWALIGSFLHYTLPQVDIARITDTYEVRVSPGNNSLFWSPGDAGSASDVAERDVFFIQTRLANDKVMVYRNEDTGWYWPPYFKFDTANLQAEAADKRSTADNPQYVAIRHYGWRFEVISIYPNVLSIRPVDGPDASKPIPWLNIIILTALGAVFWGIWVRWRRFREKRIDPTLDDIQNGWEATEDAVAAQGGRFRRWLSRQFGG